LPGSFKLNPTVLQPKALTAFGGELSKNKGRSNVQIEKGFQDDRKLEVIEVTEMLIQYKDAVPTRLSISTAASGIRVTLLKINELVKHCQQSVH
jgi:hypothetical protein